MRLIGLAGKKGSGKTTLANLIGGERLSFATPIKDALVAMGISRSLLEDPKLKEIPHASLQGRSPRYVMQTLGTEWGRNLIGRKFWSDIVANKIKTSKSATLVVDDIRFVTEINALSTLGAFFVYIDRPGLVPDPHVSENLNPINLKIPLLENTGSPEELLEAFNALYNGRT